LESGAKGAKPSAAVPVWFFIGRGEGKVFSSSKNWMAIEQDEVLG
jgi:hypothetical protein